MGTEAPTARWFPVTLGGVLDESKTPAKLGQSGFVQLQNTMYRRFGSSSKRVGSGLYGGGGAIGSSPVRSGYRWYRGTPSFAKQLIAQSADTLYLGNDGTGAMTSIGSLAAGSSAAMFCSSFDPAESGVGGTPASDVMIVAYGSGPPKKWDGTNLTQLSSAIANPFTGCEFFHEHVWLWGDPAFPDTVFATDLGNPESYAFSTSFGGYDVGRGDGDPFVQRCIALGDTLFIFKSNSIYVIQGYDFQSGEYQFSLEPIVTGIGIPSPWCVARVRNALIFWSGQRFYRLAYGSTEPEAIGRPLLFTSANVAANNQSLIRAVGGDFVVTGQQGQEVYNNVALFAADTSGIGHADTVLVYDEDASQHFGDYAWSIWSGLNVGCWIPTKTNGEQSTLFFGDSSIGQVYQFGTNPNADIKAGPISNPIQVSIQTGLIDCGTPDIKKHLSRVYIDTIANAASFSVSAVSDTTGSQSVNAPTTAGSVAGIIGTAIIGSTAILGTPGGQLYQAPEADFRPSIDGHNFQITIQESSITSAYELLAINLEILEESYLR